MKKLTLFNCNLSISNISDLIPTAVDVDYLPIENPVCQTDEDACDASRCSHHGACCIKKSTSIETCRCSRLSSYDVKKFKSVFHGNLFSMKYSKNEFYKVLMKERDVKNLASLHLLLNRQLFLKPQFR